jgi:hypothetical protein
MDVLGVVVIAILFISLAVIVFWDPLEKYDKNLDSPDFKISGTYGTRPSISTPTSIQGGSSGGGGPALLPGQNAQSRYTFSGGVNAYGESYGQVFPSTKH